ncbi:hypothetical protein [Bowmanella pacifica]|uniref:Uncharacterized protein n=1 Tax=Bowmanella pacifica TaxID=502051 RepID=A0A917YW08_9ALTE|nr:hypothetical protein [Bowmanella pacifica]GGO67014.1 hypothetical protein GCM10010982_12430 [Bowmanella pacifica]
MRISKVLKFLLFILFSQIGWANPQPPLVVATALWSPHFVNELEDGIYQKLLREVYPKRQINYVYTSYVRSKHLVATGRADLWLGSYLNEEDWALYPRFAHDADLLAAIYLKDTSWQGADSLFRQPVSWISGYDYDKYLAASQMQFYEVPDLNVAMTLLQGERIQYVLDDVWEFNTYLSENDALRDKIHMTPFAIIKIYPAFNNDKRGQLLAAQWDLAMETLVSGRLKSLFLEKGEDYLLDACDTQAEHLAQYDCLELPLSPQ